MSFLLMIYFLNSTDVFSQGYNHTWLLCYHTNLSNPTDTMARMDFDTSNYTLVHYQRKMPFMGTQGNISDENGNFLMSSNGIWIANSIGDTMPNGTGLNPGWLVDDYKSFGLPLTNANIILPMPDDTNKFVLFHQTAGILSLSSPEIFYTIMDKTLDNGKGDVISKNNVALSGTFGHGMAACKHGNGRDWWVVAFSNNADTIYKFLLSPNNVQYAGFQKLNVPVYGGWAGQPVFSPDGEKFAYRNAYFNSISSWYQNLRLFHFDRCDGLFTLDTIIDYTDSILGFGSSFSPNSKYLYVSSAQYIYQYNTDTSNIAASKQTVAVNDTFNSAGWLTTDFMLMYLAANGKIYITSGNSVLHLHEMDYPDSAGVACNVNLHNIVLNCLNFRTVPVHPNYYLGRKIGSVCDTLTSINDLTEHNFKFSISPNPTSGIFKIIYLLPQNQKGVFEVYDVTGKKVFSYHLPQWSTLQNFDLSFLGSGVYSCVITSNNQRVSKKIAIIKE
ncbi:MAG: T9SS type A sorting domain-containing protein [Bacteroidetes bacterium]|nr:T9SS type A sorting domain-containing protein [Bacteroidota bacterium]